MVKLLSIITIVLTLVFFPPAALALLSNNAVPGDRTYPVKRGLEDIIYSVASLNSLTKAWFASARSDRRFKELTSLITQGKEVKQTLAELVDQTNTAAVQLSQVTDTGEKEKIKNQLIELINKYDQTLQQIQFNSHSNVAAQIPQLAVSENPTPKVSASPIPQVTPLPSPASSQTSNPTLSSRPLPPVTTSIPTPNPSPSIKPPLNPMPAGSVQPADVQNAIEALDDIKKRIKEENHEENHNKMQKEGKNNENEKKDSESSVSKGKDVGKHESPEDNKKKD